MKKLINFFKDEEGATMVEYGLTGCSDCSCLSLPLSLLTRYAGKTAARS